MVTTASENSHRQIMGKISYYCFHRIFISGNQDRPKLFWRSDLGQIRTSYPLEKLKFAHRLIMGKIWRYFPLNSLKVSYELEIENILSE